MFIYDVTHAVTTQYLYSTIIIVKEYIATQWLHCPASSNPGSSKIIDLLCCSVYICGYYVCSVHLPPQEVSLTRSCSEALDTVPGHL